MSPVAERDEMVRRLLAEVAPGAMWRVDADGPYTMVGGLLGQPEAIRRAIVKAARLSLLHIAGISIDLPFHATASPSPGHCSGTPVGGRREPLG